MTLKPYCLALARAPSAALRENSASSAAIAMVCGFGFCSAATWKKPSVSVCFGFGPPVGINEKYLGYLNSALASSPNRLMKVLFFCMTMGMAGAIILVA